MRTPPDKTIAFTFMSGPVERPELRWTAKLVFPPGSGPDTVLPVEVADADGAPVAEATLELAGARLKVAGGKASMKYSEFAKGQRSVPLWLYRKGMPAVPGALTFA